MGNIKRILIPFEDHFWEFYEAQDATVREKIDYVLEIVISMPRIPGQFLKMVVNGLYEIRIKTGNNIYRIFCFFEQGNIFILLHGIQKKIQKLSKREIKRATELRDKYYEIKNNQ